MNPANNSLNRTYIIGGPPRIGKTILASKLADLINGHVVGTDAIRDAVKKATTDKSHDIFTINRQADLSENEWLHQHFKKPKKVVDLQNKESNAFGPSIIGFLNTFCEDDMQHIVEGVAILPKFVSQMQYKPTHILFVGNNNSNIYKQLLDYSSKYPEKDWMKTMRYTNKRIEAMSVFISEMSKFFKDESEKYGYNYLNLGAMNFTESIKKAVSIIAQ